MRKRITISLLCLLLLLAPSALSQRSQSRSDFTPPKRQAGPSKRNEYTFARLRYSGGYGRRGGWATDYPKADEQFLYGLRNWCRSSLGISDDPVTVPPADKEIFKYPFVYAVEPGMMELSEEDAANMREYLMRGGFLMLDDFWGEYEWANMEREIKKVFPGRNFVELPLDHPIYHCVFEIKSKGQVPGIRYWERGGGTSERSDSREVHHRAIFDDQGRMMVIATHNTDNGDGWEREGENDWFFHEFSEKRAFPLGINIIFWAMTH